MATLIYKEGCRGDMVKRIQRVAGCYPDGVWGRLTTEAVKAWQSAHKLKADGIVGPATLAAMGLVTIKDKGAAAVTNGSKGRQHGRIWLKQSRRKIREIIIHCAATPEGKAYTVEDVRKWHKDQGWSDIGYNYVIELDGTPRIGRDVDISGAHCTGHNTYSIGICYIGGVENTPGVASHKQKAKDTRTDAQKAEMFSLLMDLRRMYPEAVIYGHHDFDRGKDCPSFDAKKEYRKI